MLLNLAFKSLCFRKGGVIITVMAIAISVFTLLSVEQIRHGAKHSFNSTVSGVDLIVGPRTSDINLLLTTVFRIGQPSQNMSWESYQYLVKHPRVSWVIPISLGDSHRGFRVVGTQDAFFSRFEYGQSNTLAFSKGAQFKGIYDVVLGANVARELKYDIDQKLIIAHGLGQTSFQKHDAFPFRVSGILKPTGTPVDNALYVSLVGLEAIHLPQGVQANQANIKIEPKSISAALVKLNSKLATFKVQRDINTSINEPLTAILPGVTLAQLWQMSRGVERALNGMAILILFASLMGMGAVITATLRERYHEFAVLRTLGAGPLLIFTLIQVEALFIALLGAVLGGAVFLIAVAILSDNLALTYGIDLGFVINSPHFIIVPLYVLAGTFIAATIPALVGYIRAHQI